VVGESATAAAEDEAAGPEPVARRRRATATAPAEEKRKKEQKLIDKIKASKRFQKRKRNDDEDSDYEDELARAIFQERSAPLPGQMENCAGCGKRFTVTPYSRNAPDGGLLCSPCGKELAKTEDVPKKKPKRISGALTGRRQVQSNILDGTFYPGAKSLMTLCIETLAKNIDLAEDLGDLPEPVIDKIARKLSKHRLLNPSTLSLFIQPTVEQIHIYDSAKLTADDFVRVFQTAPNLKKLKAYNAVHFKDEVMDYLLSRNINLEDFYLSGANLVSEEKWKEFLEKKGKPLRSLRVYWTDKHFSDGSLAVLATACPSLERLKVYHNQRVTGDGVKVIAKIKTLRHLGLDLREHVHPDVFVGLLAAIGKDLETLSLARMPDLDNSVLDAIHNKCRSLRKLRLTDSDTVTDEGFERLFKDWDNKELFIIDFQKCRQLDSVKPRENPNGIGLCSKGFTALMEHSGRKLRHLNVHGCRNISAAAFEEVFSAEKVYPELKKVEISFCEEVTDFIVGSIFRSCPNLRELNVFGCMKVKDVKVPRGKILVGVPNALGMVIDGDDD
jgi:DNA repair protein RAD7